MTGPEHYREAERLIKACEYAAIDGTVYIEPDTDNALNIAAAQVHAMLALVAVQVDTSGNTLRSNNWAEAVS